MLIFKFIQEVLSKKKPRRALNTKRAARWGLVAHSVVEAYRAATLGKSCGDCKFYEPIQGEKKGVCQKFKQPGVTLLKSEGSKMGCLVVESKKVFCSFRTRISGKGSDNDRKDDNKETKKENRKKESNIQKGSQKSVEAA